MDALQSFITTMEPEASFTVRLEEQAGEEGVTKTSIIILIFLYNQIL